MSANNEHRTSQYFESRRQVVGPEQIRRQLPQPVVHKPVRWCRVHYRAADVEQPGQSAQRRRCIKDVLNGAGIVDQIEPFPNFRRKVSVVEIANYAGALVVRNIQSIHFRETQSIEEARRGP